MLRFKIFSVSCLLIIWTRIEYGLTVDTSTGPYQELDSMKSSPIPPPAAAVAGEGFNEELHEGKNEATVEAAVRKFFPVKGKQKWMRREFPPVTEMLFFNISTIGDNEEVTLAQLYLHRRRLTKSHINYHKRFLPSPYRVVLYQVQPNYRHKSHEDARTMKLASVPVSHATKGGWQTLDVTAVVRELLINAQGPVELLLGIQFEAPKRLDKSYSPLVPLKHFLKNPGSRSPERPYRASSYMIIYSETDPYFEDFEDDATPTTMPSPTQERHPFKERHLKHKIIKNNENDFVESNHIDEPTAHKKKVDPFLKKENKDKWKYKKVENEVYKKTEGKNDLLRHKGKHKGIEVKRSKADELALKEKTKLELLPYLHANEVEEIRQTSRRLTRSLATRGHRETTKPRGHENST